MQVGGTGSWERRCDEQEAQQLRCEVDDHRTRFADGVVEVRTIDGICTAKVIWRDGYGERALERGPYAFVHAQIGEILRHGPSFGPVHSPDRERLEFFRFTSDGSLRATRPHGELRVKAFLDQSVLLFVPDGGFRLLFVSEDRVKLVQAAEIYGAQWASLAGPRWAVSYQGKHHELRVSNLASELAFCELDRRTRFSLRAHRLPEGDEPAVAALELVRGDHVTRLALVPFDPESDVVVIWSDRQVDHPAPPPPSQAGPSPASPPGQTDSSGTTTPRSIAPAVLALLEKYIRWFVGQPKHEGLRHSGDWRRQISPLLRAAERGVNVAGCGASFRRALERAGGFDAVSGQRAFCYWVKAFRDDGILVRACGPRRSVFVFEELCDLNSPAVAGLCAWAGVSVESLAGAGTVGDPSEPTTDRPPPSAPPPSPPPSEARESSRQSSPASPATPTAPSWDDAEPHARVRTDASEPPTSTWPSAAPTERRGTGDPTWTIPTSFANWPTADGGSTPKSTGAPRGPASTPRSSPPPVDVFADGEELMGQPDFLFLGRHRPLRDEDGDQEIDEGNGSARGPPDEETEPGEPEGS